MGRQRTQVWSPPQAAGEGTWSSSGTPTQTSCPRARRHPEKTQTNNYSAPGPSTLFSGHLEGGKPSTLFGNESSVYSH